MPEGPSIVILKELAQPFSGKKILHISGNTKVDVQQAEGKHPTFKTWGKHFLICFDDFSIRIHLMLFGSYRINEERENMHPRLRLQFENGFINFYACSIKLIEEDLNVVYDWSEDIMNANWDEKAAKKKLLYKPGALLCDTLLDQHIFSGSGNIIKNEVMFRVRLHPLNKIGTLPDEKLTELIQETRNYAFDFLRWQKEFVLKKHWLVHTKSICPRCNIPLKKAYLGKTNRRTFYCDNCQQLYYSLP